MDKVIALIIGALCGIGQFLMIRHTLKPLSEGEDPQIAKLMILKLPIPLALLFGCAFINTDLLPFAGIAFCLSLVTASVANHLRTMKKRGDDT